MKCDYDVIVVGARVAGASTAMLLARQGYDVLMIDRTSMPSDTVSTHAILRTGVLQLTRWGLIDRVVNTGTPPVDRITLGFGDERIPFRVKPDFGIAQLYAPRRSILDGLLVEAAVRDGVEFAERTRLTDVIRGDGGEVRGITAGLGAETMDVRAPMVIGADGFRSRLAQLVGAPVSEQHIPRNVVHYAYYTGIEDAGFWFQFTPGINAGLIATNDGATCVFVGRPGGEENWRRDPQGEFRRLLSAAGDDLAERVAGGTRMSSFRGNARLPAVIRRPWGAGWALVGDAGYSKDPISAHGMSDAFRDAELCARAVDRSLRNPAESATAMAEYERVRDALSRPIFEHANALADYRWDAEEASSRMRVISEAVRQECAALLALPAWPGIDRAIPA